MNITPENIRDNLMRSSEDLAGAIEDGDKDYIAGMLEDISDMCRAMVKYIPEVIEAVESGA